MLKDKLLPFLERYNELSTLLSDPNIATDIKKMTSLSKEQSGLEKIKDKTLEYFSTLEQIEENKLLLEDEELGELAKEELKTLEPRKEEIEEEIKVLLLPTDPNDERNIFLEIRAGTGGDEAAIFAADLFKSYLRYAENRGWKVEVVSLSEGVLNGFKEVIALVKGQGAFSCLNMKVVYTEFNVFHSLNHKAVYILQLSLWRLCLKLTMLKSTYKKKISKLML